MILSAIAAKLKQRAKGDFKGRHYEAAFIVQAVSWYLRYPISYRDIEELFLERGMEVDPSTLNRWVLAYAPLIEKRLRQSRKPHCGSVRIDETYIKVRGEWRYLYRAIDKHGEAVDFLLTARRDLNAAKRFFRKMLVGQPLLAPDRIGTDGAGIYPPAIIESRKAGLLPRTNCSGPASDSRRLTKPKNETDLASAAAYGTDCDRPDVERPNAGSIDDGHRLLGDLNAQRQHQPEAAHGAVAPASGFSRSRMSLPALKWSLAFASTETGAPFLGLRPIRARDSTMVKEPNPRSSTRSPAAMASEIRPKMASTTAWQSRS